MKRLVLFAFLTTTAGADQFDQLITKPTPAPKQSPVTQPQPLFIRHTATAPKAASVKLYAPGRFPSGIFYRVPDLKQLAGRPLPQRAYLVGRLLYLGQKEPGRYFFAPYVLLPSAYLKAISGERLNSLDIGQGTTRIAVTFHNNLPKDLRPGTAIAPDETNPITLRTVRLTFSGIQVDADYFGTP
jgi:hypothetical protein